MERSVTQHICWVPLYILPNLQLSLTPSVLIYSTNKEVFWSGNLNEKTLLYIKNTVLHSTKLPVKALSEVFSVLVVVYFQTEAFQRRFRLLPDRV